jgi:hypothetical protein
MEDTLQVDFLPSNSAQFSNVMKMRGRPNMGVSIIYSKRYKTKDVSSVRSSKRTANQDLFSQRECMVESP